MENQNNNQETHRESSPLASSGGGQSSVSPNNQKTQPDRQAAADELAKALAEEKSSPQRVMDSPHPGGEGKDSIFQIRRPHEQPHPSGEPDPSLGLPEAVVPRSGVTNSPFKKSSSPQNPAAPAPRERSVAEHILKAKPAPVPPTPSAVPPDPHKSTPHAFVPNPKLKTLRTFHGDMAEIVRNKGESVTSIAVAARKKKDEEVKPRPVTVPAAERADDSLARLTREKYPQKPSLPHTPPRQSFHAPAPKPENVSLAQFEHHATMPAITTINPRKNEAIPVKAAAGIPFFKNTILLVVSIAILGIGGFTLYTVFFAKMAGDREITVDQPNTIVAYDSYNPVPLLERSELISHITALKSTLPAEGGGVAYAFIEADPEAVLVEAVPDIPEVLSRILEHPYAIGYYRDGKEGVFFMALTVESFGQALSGMLSWEDTLYGNLRELLGAPPQTTVGGFADAIIENKDVRRLLGANEQAVLVYGFIDDTTLIITENEASFRGIANNILIKRSTR